MEVPIFGKSNIQIPFKYFHIAHCQKNVIDFLIFLFKFPLSVLNLMCHVREKKLNSKCHIPNFLYFPRGESFRNYQTSNF